MKTNLVYVMLLCTDNTKLINTQLFGYLALFGSFWSCWDPFQKNKIASLINEDFQN